MLKRSSTLIRVVCFLVLGSAFMAGCERDQPVLEGFCTRPLSSQEFTRLEFPDVMEIGQIDTIDFALDLDQDDEVDFYISGISHYRLVENYLNELVLAPVHSLDIRTGEKAEVGIDQVLNQRSLHLFEKGEPLGPEVVEWGKSGEYVWDRKTESSIIIGLRLQKDGIERYGWLEIRDVARQPFVEGRRFGNCGEIIHAGY